MKFGELHKIDFGLSENVSAHTKITLRTLKPQEENTERPFKFQIVYVFPILVILVERKQGQFYFGEVYSKNKKKSM